MHSLAIYYEGNYARYARHQKPTSREDYLKLEEVSTEKHELYQGQVFAIASGTFKLAVCKNSLVKQTYIFS